MPVQNVLPICPTKSNRPTEKNVKQEIRKAKSSTAKNQTRNQRKIEQNRKIEAKKAKVKKQRKKN